MNIGILPGATGTQRFPRLVGLEAALDLIPNGTRFDAEKALRLGVIDKVFTQVTLETFERTIPQLT